MSTQQHRFVAADIRHVPPPAAVAATLDWLRAHVQAYKIEAINPGHISFFDGGGLLDIVACPRCRTDVAGPLWKAWMDDSFTPATGVSLTERTLPCCNTTTRLDQLYFDPRCAFGSFAIEITDPSTTWSDDELAALQATLALQLQCQLTRVDARYCRCGKIPITDSCVGGGAL